MPGYRFFTLVAIASFLVSNNTAGQSDGPCCAVLKYGIWQTTNIAGSHSSESSFSNWLQENQFSSFEKARDAGLSLGIILKGLPIAINGHDRSNEWGLYQKELNQLITKNSKERSEFSEFISRADPAVLHAWETCLRSEGLHLVKSYTEDVMNVSFSLNYVNNGEPYFVMVD